MKDPMAMGWPQSAPIVDAGTPPARDRADAVARGALVRARRGRPPLARASLQPVRVRRARARAERRRRPTTPVSPPSATLLGVALASGALAGTAGVAEVAGLKGYLTLDLSPGFGYTGIAVAMLADLHPLGIVLSAVFLAGITVGADSMSRALDVPSYIADVMVASAVLAVLVGLMLARYRVRRH